MSYYENEVVAVTIVVHHFAEQFNLEMNHKSK